MTKNIHVKFAIKIKTDLNQKIKHKIVSSNRVKTRFAEPTRQVWLTGLEVGAVLSQS